MTQHVLPAFDAYDRRRVSAGIAHLGVGNFHRAHQAVYTDGCLRLPGQEGWGILGIGLQDTAGERAKADALRCQEGLYSLTIYPPDAPPTASIIGSLVEYLHAPDDPEKVLHRLSEPAIRIVTLTITEGGYNLDAGGDFRLDHPDIARDLAADSLPSTAFGLLTEALRRRHAAGVGPFTVLSCDNLRHNGHVAATALLSFARARDPELATWIERTVTFPSCMVDRITPAVGIEEAARLNAANGYEDAVPVFSEDYIQWVIEDRFCAGRPRWEEAGAEFTDDVGPYEQVKLRLLNATHVMLAYPALLAGYRFVHEAMADADIRALIEQFLHLDAAPLVTPPAGLSKDAYSALVLRRFANPAINDQVLRLASDGMSKLPVYAIETTREIVAKGRNHSRIAFQLAAFAEHLYRIGSPDHVSSRMEPHYHAAHARLVHDPDLSRILDMEMFDGWGLQASPDFVPQFVDYRRSIRTAGVRDTLSKLIKTKH